jgi:multiple sugar transport system ATP-binding protein
VRNVPKAEHHARVMRAAEMVELGPLLDRRPAALSGGQRQRVALARAIVREPNAFLMDEPLSNLDAKLRVSTRAQIKNLHHTLKTTTIYVTHDQIEAMTLADRVVVMNKGEVQQLGTPTEIYDRPANTFVASFIGSPAMNLIAGQITDGTFHAEGMQVAGLSGNGPATLGFRAEDASVVTEGGNISAPVYAMELLGDATLVSVRIGPALVSVRAPKDFRIEIGSPMQIRVPVSVVHLFDATTGARIAG